MTIKSSYPVLIIGAGPTGMELAAELQRYGIDFLITDKRPSHVTTSNAAGIHARTLECWHKRPWSQDFLTHGLKMRGVSMNSKNQRLSFLDFNTLPNTEYPFILSIPQNETEKILDEHLTRVKTPVVRNTTLIHFTTQQNKVVAQFATPEGNIEVTADWLVGCDGYHSTVREHTKIPFEGDDIEEQFLLVDADFTANYETDSFHVYVAPEGILAFFGMKHSTRIIAATSNDPRFKDVTEPTAEIMSEIIRERTKLTFKLPSISWQSHFWIHERVAKQLKKENIFLAGDAAHVHSPAGGQGMNTGIQDAHNLAWKLAYVLKGYAPKSLLDSYEAERLPNAKNVVNMTSKMTTMARLRQPWLVALRDHLFPLVAKQPFVQKEMMGRLSQLALHYPESNIIGGKKIGKLAPGDRAPDVLIDASQKKYLFDEFDNLTHNLLVFHASETEKNILAELLTRYKNILTVIYCDQETIQKVYSCKTFYLCLIRPDGYISYLGEDLNSINSSLAAE